MTITANSTGKLFIVVAWLACVSMYCIALGTCASYKVTTIAGGNSEFKNPQKIATLSNGDVIVSDTNDHTIKRINMTSFTITTIAGTGVAGSSGDGALAINAQLNKPYGIAVSSNDEIYIADSLNHRIRKIDVNGTITTIAGTSSGFSGDGDLATSCKLNTPMDVSMNTAGELYIADMYNYRIRMVSSNGTINTVFGNGQSGHSGDGDLAINATLALVYGVRAFSNGEVYISDSHNFKVRKVDVNGTISTIAGSGAGPYNGDNILATSANLNHPTDIAMLSTGEILIADTDNYRVRMVLTNGTIVTLAGNGTATFYDNEVAENSAMSTVTGLVVTSSGILVVDSGNARIRLISVVSSTPNPTPNPVQPTCFGANTTDLNVCSGHGSCVSLDTCNCTNGWSGSNCNVSTTPSEVSCFSVLASNSSVCSGHGSCLAVDTCNCTTGWSGSTCNVSTTPSETSCFSVLASNSSVCSGHGSCVSLDTCNCTNGWSGSNCSVSSTPNPTPNPVQPTCFGANTTDLNVCSGHGSCVSLDTCNCTNGWSGSNCNVSTTPSEVSCFSVLASNSSVCNGHGSCLAVDTCNCTTGWSGSTCNVSTTPSETTCFSVLASSSSSVCNGHGSCVALDTCQCTTGWSGLNCNVTSCFGKSAIDPSVCNGKGSCIGENVCSCLPGFTQTPTCISTIYYITTLAGANGELKDPQKLAQLSNGDIIVSDASDHSVKRINITSGAVSRIAGTGVAGSSGDGALAINAKLNKPFGIAVSSNDEIYIADSLNHRIRKIDNQGVITTIAGTSSGFSGDGDLATSCKLNTPMDVSMNTAGELYIADMYNHRIRKVLTNGTINTVFGNGQSGHSGDGGLAINAALALVYGVRAFSNGEVYISDSHNFKVRKVDVNGIITTIAGSGAGPYNGDNILATSANLNHPSDVAMLPTGELLIADADNYRVRMVLTNSTIITLAGNGTGGFFGDYGVATSAELSVVPGLLITSQGILIADAVNGKVRLLSTQNPNPNPTNPTQQPTCYGKVSTDPLACNGQGICIAENTCSCIPGFEGPTCLASKYYIMTVVGANGELKDPQKLAKLSNGDVIVSDSSDHSIKRINVASYTITRIAGTGVAGFSGDGALAINAKLNKPFGIAVSSNDEIYIADSLNHRIRKIDNQGVITTVVGTSSGFSGDGDLATSCKLNTPMDVSMNTAGELYIADMYNHRIRKVLTNGTINTVFGNGQSGHSGDGGLAINAALALVYGVRAFSNGEVYISDSHNFKVRKVDVNGTISTIAGSGAGPYNGDNILATSANLNHPSDVAMLPTGELLIADADNYRVRMVLINGTIITVAGNGVSGFSGDYGVATSAKLGAPTGILMMEHGFIIADSFNGKIRFVVGFPLNPPTCFGVQYGDASICGGHGSCLALDTCNCTTGWSGSTCNVSTTPSETSCFSILASNSLVCGGHGSCVALDTCQCTTGWSGSNCNISTTPSEVSCFSILASNSLVCSGHGSCVLKDTCQCTNGWSGSNCNISTTPSETTCFSVLASNSLVCGGHGSCVALDTCQCSEGFFGLNCNLTKCSGVLSNDASVCSGNGVCISGACHCVSGFVGTVCSEQGTSQCTNSSIGIHIQCSGHGNCNNSVCQCASGFYGQYCSIYSMIATSPYSHAMTGIHVASDVSSLSTLDVITNVESTWSQVSGPTLDLASLAGSLNRPQLIIPGKFSKLSLDNSLKSDTTYGFSLTSKVTTTFTTVTFTQTTTTLVQKDPTLTFLLQDANTNQNITSGVAGTTIFKVTITGNSNPYSDSEFGYGFGFSDSDAITILTDLSPNPATFKLPFISGKSTIDIYVGAYGSKSMSIQKLTTISLTNPVANLPTSQAITTISNLITSNSSIGDLLGAASLLNTVSTSDNSQISSKANIRNDIIQSLSNVIASADLGSALKALESVTSTTSELTQTSASNALDALIGSTLNSKFSADSVQSIINIASNAIMLTSGSKSSELAKSIGGKLSPSLSFGDVVSAGSTNMDLTVAKGVSSMPVGSTNVDMITSGSRFLGCFLLSGAEALSCFAVVAANGQTRVAKQARRGSSLTMLSKVYDFMPLYPNGTEATSVIVNGYFKIAIPYSGTVTPICGRYDSVSQTTSVDPTMTTIKQVGSVICQTKNLSGNVLLARPVSASVDPEKSTKISGGESLGVTLKYFTCLILLVFFLL